MTNKDLMKKVEKKFEENRIQGSDWGNFFGGFTCGAAHALETLGQSKISVTKQTVANLATHMQDGVEYEIVLREVGK